MNNHFQINLKNVTKNFEGLDVPVLKNLSFNINSSEKIAILGSSGSGKSTLLHIIAGLDSPSEGKVLFNNLDMGNLSDNKMAKLRNQHIGFVYQSHHLLNDFSSIENVMMPLIVRRGDYLNDFNQILTIYRVMMIKILKYCLIILVFNIFSIKQTMSYEEPKYKTIKSTEVYEIREYGDRLAVEIEYSNEDSGFRYLFNYISGENKSSEKVKMTVPVTQSVKIDMTTPVTQSTRDGKMKMQFFLPSKFTLENAPQPTNNRVNLIIIKGGIYAVISYSGRLTNQNYSKHYKKLINHLNEDKIDFIEPAIRATFNGPFTLPIFRRNEIMIKINYNEIN